MANNIMTYEDYRKVALKQLKTCKRLQTAYSSITSLQEKNDILRSIFYLSGYIIEGTINYSIYKLLSHPPTDDVKTLHNSFASGKTISFSYSQQRRGSGEKYYIQNHKFMKNVDVLSTRLPTKFNTIPVLGNNRSQHRRLFGLLNRWNVNVRYHTQQTTFQPFSFERYSEQDIFDFLDLAIEIYKKLPQIV